MKNVIIDTDPGIDDAIAIMMALKDPGLNVLALTAVTGNVTSDVASINARKVLDLMRSEEIPVAQGPMKPLQRDWPKDPFFHGDDGLANNHFPETARTLDSRSAAQVLVDLVNEHANDVSLLALGPMTNIALALEIDPDLPSKVSEIYAIAGAFGFTRFAFEHATGDNPASEWNVYVDPEAADIVFRAGFNLTLLPLDVGCHDGMNISDQQFEELAESDRPEAQFVASVLRFVRGRGYAPYSGIIDALATAACADDSLLTTRDTLVGVETSGTMTLGMTVKDIRGAHMWTDLPTLRVATDVDFPRFTRDLVARLTE